MANFTIIEEPEKFTTEQKKEIAERFISKHKHLKSDWYGLLSVFANLEAGVFGDVEENFEGVFSIEIGKHETKSGQTEIFEF